MESISFVADVHLGKLARNLRMLGFDTVYQHNFTLDNLVKIAIEEKRVLLSRNAALLKNSSITFFWIENEEPLKQLGAVVDHFDLGNRFSPFTRCLICNGQLMIIEKEMIVSQLEENTASYYHEFWQCSNCKRVYWKGAHYKRMQKLLSFLKSSGRK